MAIYTVEVRDSDGNDCYVMDLLIDAETPEQARDKAWEWVKAEYPKDEEDGCDGTFHPCDCVCDHRKRSVCSRCQETWECSHGGLLVGEPELGDQSCSYHQRITVDA